MTQWYPLVPAERIHDPARTEAIVAHAMRLAPPGLWDETQIRQVLVEESTLPLFRNNLYQVAVRTSPTDMKRGDGKDGTVNRVHLSIKRLDREPARDWRDLQRIKNQLLGDECEAIELFPAESRLVDTANQTHLWGYDDPTIRAPFGFFGPRIVDDTNPVETGTRQRKFSS